jgi:nucleoside-diphosphate-sugar epimerase
MKAFVTGGNGYIGGAVVRLLRERGHQVTAASRRTGVDVGVYDAVARAMAGHDVVFHAAALPRPWGPRAEFERTNVTGTANVIRACREHGVRELIYTSSPSAVFDGKDHVDAGNDLPFPTTFLADYPRTKAEAEMLVRAANGPGLRTVSLRPHLVYGPGEPNLLPRLLQRARSGRLAIVGDGTNVVSLTYIDNAAIAHLQAREALAAAGAGSACLGNAYFIADAAPVELWGFVTQFLAGVGAPVPTRRVPRGVAHAIGSMLELGYGALGIESEPPMTRFVAAQMATSHSYDMGPAYREIGYAPVVDGTEGLRRTIEAWRGA